MQYFEAVGDIIKWPVLYAKVSSKSLSVDRTSGSGGSQFGLSLRPLIPRLNKSMDSESHYHHSKTICKCVDVTSGKNSSNAV